MSKKTKISVIVATKNRPSDISRLIESITKSSFQNFELVIVDQSNKEYINKHTKKQITINPNIKYIHSKLNGKSKNLNLAIKNSSAPLLVFTDDDCLPDIHWLKNIIETFEKNPHIAGTFGRTLPYQSSKHKGLICPSTFDHKIERYITKPCKHWEKIGFGNNMAWRKSFFEEYGLFKEWLGPGSIGSNAEDAEIALRALINKQVLFFNPQMIVFHNRWLTKHEYQRQMLSYICGEMACYEYLAKRNISIGKTIIKNNFIKSKNWFVSLNDFTDFKNFSKQICFQVRGFAVGFFLD